MHCIYCGVDYSLDEPCWCLPRSCKPAEVKEIMQGVWGDAVKEWSLRASNDANWIQGAGEA